MSQSISLYKQLANHKLFNKTINFDLKRIKLVLKKLDHPERKLKNVVNFPLEPRKLIILLSFFSGFPNFLSTDFILFKSKFMVLLNSL